MAQAHAVLVALLLIAAVPASDAQPAARVHRIGILSELTRSQAIEDFWRSAFAEKGYTEGKNAKLEFRWADEHFERLPALAEELIRLKVDVIVTGSTPPALAAKRLTTTVPIITISADPIGSGLVASLPRPAGNVTGVFVPYLELTAKRVQLLRETVPGLDSVAILFNPLNETARSSLQYAVDAARTMGIATTAIEMRTQADLDTVSTALAGSRVRGLVVIQDPVTLQAAREIAEIAAKLRLPGSFPYKAFAEAGGLMSYGVSLRGVGEAAAQYADRVLRGAAPSDLPMEMPKRYEFVVNLKTAKALGIKIPQSILVRAEELIE